jgi:hypothetical protein
VITIAKFPKFVGKFQDIVDSKLFERLNGANLQSCRVKFDLEGRNLSFNCPCKSWKELMNQQPISHSIMRSMAQIYFNKFKNS